MRPPHCWAGPGPPEEEKQPSRQTQCFSLPAPGTHQVLMCAAVAGAESGPARTGSDHPWCLTLASWVYWLPWGPSRPSLEWLWIRKQSGACLGLQPGCAQGGLFSPKSSFLLPPLIPVEAILPLFYLWAFTCAVPSAWNIPCHPPPYSLHLVDSFLGLGFSTHLLWDVLPGPQV